MSITNSLMAAVARKNLAVGGFSAEAQDYFDRLDTAGDTTYTPYKQPIANYIDGLVALGGAYWGNMESAALFVGVGLQGVVVPLRSDMPALTNNNFISADLSQTTGLLGDGVTKQLALGLAGTDLIQNDASISVYISSASTINSYYIGNDATSGSIFLRTSSGAANAAARLHSTANVQLGGASLGFLGATRSDGVDLDYRIADADATTADASATPRSASLYLFQRSNATLFSDARIATYHVGADLSLSTLEALQDTLISEIAAI